MRVALAQMTSTEDRASNLAAAEELLLEAARSEADFFALPENFSYLRSEGSRMNFRERLDGALVGRFSTLAREKNLWVLLGSIPEEIGDDSGKVYNTSVLIDRSGEVRAVYRKIHLFDIAMPGGPQLRESEAIAAGERVVVAESEFGPIGLSICYDLRFPELYRDQSRRGARILLAPAAFTDRTGRDHWHLLTRARAMENQCFLLAPAQSGRHSERRASYGHTLVADPWGRIVAERGEAPGLLVAYLDLAEIDRVRSSLPVLTHRRL